jgi:hypothetical protein
MTLVIDPKTIKELEQRLGDATPSTWWVRREDLVFGPNRTSSVFRIVSQDAIDLRRAQNSSAEPTQLATVHSQQDAQLVATARNTLPALLADRSELISENERLRSSRDAILNHWYPRLGYACANEMAYPALGDRRAAEAPVVALLREIQLAPLRAEDGRALVTLDLEILRRIAAVLP